MQEEFGVGARCAHCGQDFPLVRDDVAVQLFPTEPFSALNTSCPHCQNQLTLQMPTIMAGWLQWAGLPTDIVRGQFKVQEVHNMLHTLHDEQLFEDEVAELLRDIES